LFVWLFALVSKQPAFSQRFNVSRIVTTVVYT